MAHTEAVARWWTTIPTKELVWIAVGLLAQFMFSMRFVVQWLATEKARASIVPEAFWYFSLGGGVMLLAYAIYRIDPVFILGQAAGLGIYARNIHFIWLTRQEQRLAELDKIALAPR